MGGRANSCGPVTSRSSASINCSRCKTGNSACISCTGGGIGGIGGVGDGIDGGIGGGTRGCKVINTDYLTNNLLLSLN